METLVNDERLRKIILKEWSEEFQKSNYTTLKKCASCKRFIKKRKYLEVYKSSFADQIQYCIKCTKPLSKCKNGILASDDIFKIEPTLGLFD